MTDDERIAILQKRQSEIKAEVNRIQARKRVADRKADTRRKILLGAIVMQEMESRPEQVGVWVSTLLAARLTKPRDRALFGLQPMEANPED